MSMFIDQFAVCGGVGLHRIQAIRTDFDGDDRHCGTVVYKRFRTGYWRYTVLKFLRGIGLESGSRNREVVAALG